MARSSTARCRSEIQEEGVHQSGERHLLVHDQMPEQNRIGEGEEQQPLVPPHNVIEPEQRMAAAQHRDGQRQHGQPRGRVNLLHD